MSGIELGSGVLAASGSAVPAGYAVLIWGPLLALMLGVAVWFIALMLLQRRYERRRTARPVGAALSRVPYGVSASVP